MNLKPIQIYLSNIIFFFTYAQPNLQEREKKTNKSINQFQPIHKIL